MSDEMSEARKALVAVLQDAYDYHAELRGESERSAVILAAANFEDWLRETIMMKFVTLSKGLRKRIFENYGPLSTFTAKIDIAFALEIYDERTRKSLHIIRKIRNEFAHSPKAIKFDNAKLSRMCRRLDMGDESQSNDLRERYLTYLIEVRKRILSQENPFSRILVR